MKNRPEHPTLPRIAEIINRSTVNWYITGARALELLFGYYGVQTVRPNHDYDIAVEITDWRQLVDIREHLINQLGFSGTELPYRVHHPDGIALDIIPFGSIQDTHLFELTIDTEMEVDLTGFGEIMERGVLHIPYEHSRIPVARAESVALKKILTWTDRGEQTAHRDLIDIQTVIQQYETILGKRYFDVYYRILDTYPGLTAHYYMLGNEQRRMFAPGSALVKKVRTLFQHHLAMQHSELIEHMARIEHRLLARSGPVQYDAGSASIRAWFMGISQAASV